MDSETSQSYSLTCSNVSCTEQREETSVYISSSCSGSSGSSDSDIDISEDCVSTSPKLTLEKLSLESLDTHCSFNLYDGVVSGKPESPRRPSEPLAHRLLVVTLSAISLLIITLALYSSSSMHERHSFVGSSSQCHYDDALYPIDQKCSLYQCQETGNNQILSLKFGWSADFVTLRTFNAFNMLYSIYDKYPILPQTLYLNTMYDTDTVIELDNKSIALGYINVDIEYFCCYEADVYDRIQILFDTFEWQPFDIRFANYSCLNRSRVDLMDIVLMLDDETQHLLTQWTNSFEDHLEENGVPLLSRRSEGELFSSTLATFDDLNHSIYLQDVSMDVLHQLNTHSNQGWQNVPVSFSKSNLLMS